MTALFNFPLMTPPPGAQGGADGDLRLSIRPPWSIPRAEALRAVRDEIDYRRKVYPAQVARLALPQQDADRQVALLQAIALDLDPGRPLDPGFSWMEKVMELRREIEQRRRLYPRWIAQRRVALEDARARMEAMEAAHWRLWIYMDGWTSNAAADLAARFDPIREHQAAVHLWERSARRAGNPAARPRESYLLPGWTDQQWMDWAYGPDWKEAA